MTWKINDKIPSEDISRLFTMPRCTVHRDVQKDARGNTERAGWRASVQPGGGVGGKGLTRLCVFLILLFLKTHPQRATSS